MSRADNQKLARNLAEVIDAILCTERSRERRVELIAVQVMSAIANGYGKGFKRGREYERERWIEAGGGPVLDAAA
jgi:hypothetical protein